ncbi:MAG TPA: hypothetical protein GX005_04610 [Bacteroidales bacterium]|nr:hypothetical protein [Bacteroidales bacterium]
MNKEELIEYFKDNDEIDIYYEYLLGQDVWYFEKVSQESSKVYDDFKRFISRKLNVPFNNISIVGSAKTKYSFSPNKNFSEFHEKSDFDLIIVSSKIFNSLWQAYRNIASSAHLNGYGHIASNIFNNFISIKEDDPNYGNKIIEDWQKTILEFKAELQLTFEITHEINYRIYSDWESVEDYHLKGLRKLKTLIYETN